MMLQILVIKKTPGNKSGGCYELNTSETTLNFSAFPGSINCISVFNIYTIFSLS